VRPSHNASKQLRRKVAERDGWKCHRCGLPIDKSLVWPHPLALVADHYPIACLHGGPPIAANLKPAHSLCNGSNSTVENWREGARTDRFVFTAGQLELIEVIVNLPRDGSGHVVPLDLAGELAPADRLPSIVSLSQTCDVASATAWKAHLALEDDGLVEGSLDRHLRRGQEGAPPVVASGAPHCIEISHARSLR
jgi:hypothetical protein